LLKYELY